MTEEEKIQLICQSLNDNALGDITRASAGGSKMGAFILCSCLIDAIAGFMKGSNTQGPDYKNFVSDYLHGYDCEKLYADLRCKLVHSYSEGGSYTFVHEKPALHFCEDQMGKIIINLENFIGEIQTALKSVISRLQDDSENDLRARAIKRFDDNGIIHIYPITATGTILGSISGSGSNIL